MGSSEELLEKQNILSCSRQNFLLNLMRAVETTGNREPSPAPVLTLITTKWLLYWWLSARIIQLIISHTDGVFVSAGCHRLYLLLQDAYECPGRPGTARQPVAHRQQHHWLPPPTHPLGPLLSVGPAGAAPFPAPPTQPPQRSAPTGPQVVQPEGAPPTSLTPAFKHCHPLPALYKIL